MAQRSYRRRVALVMGGWGGRRYGVFALAFAVVGCTLAPAAQPPVSLAGAAVIPAPSPVPARAVSLVLEERVPPVAERWTDPSVATSIVPPPGWTLAAATSLNPQSDPPDPTEERVRFQMRTGDPALYAVPVPVTSALVRDAGAILSVSLAREETELAALEVDPHQEHADTAVPGFVAIDDDANYDGLRVVTRYLIPKSGERRVVVRAYVAEDEWPALEPAIRAAIGSVRSDPAGANAPAPIAPPAPPAPEAAPQPESAPVDATLVVRQEILARAHLMLSTPYVWGGNVAGRGMDCSAYVSAAWGVSRYTTDSIGRVAVAIAKEDLRPGDAMNLTIGRDPARKGHIRLFEAWANEARTLVWVYEETPPRAVHRVIAYDSGYQPIRLAGLSDAGAAPLIPAPEAAPARQATPGSERGGSQAARQAPRPTARPLAKPTPKPTPRPTAFVPYALKDGMLVPVTPAPKPTAYAKKTPSPTPKAAAKPTARAKPAAPASLPPGAPYVLKNGVLVPATPSPKPGG